MNVCGQCGDDFDEHCMISTSPDIMDGGIIVCPRRGCKCYNTWSPKYPDDDPQPPAHVPNELELAALRQRIWDAEG